jgi:hypothetical protein
MMILGYEYIIGQIPLAGIELDRKAQGKIFKGGNVGRIGHDDSQSFMLHINRQGMMFFYQLGIQKFFRYFIQIKGS